MEKSVRKKEKNIKLPYGGVAAVAAKANVSVFTVGNVLKGKSNNMKVLKAIKDYLDEVKKARQDAQNALL